MKGFTLAPVVFIVLFLIAFSISYHFFEMDKKTAEGITLEAYIKKQVADVEKQFTAASAIAFEEMVADPARNQASMETAIRNRLNLSDFGTPAVSISKVSDASKYTSVTFTFSAGKSFQKGVSMAAPTYSTVVSHPYYWFQYYRDYASGSIQAAAANRLTGGGCQVLKPGNMSRFGWVPPICSSCSGAVFSETSLEAHLRSWSPSGLNWDVSTTSGPSCTCNANCGLQSRTVSFTVTLTDPQNSLIVQPFRLPASGSFTASNY